MPHSDPIPSTLRRLFTHIINLQAEIQRQGLHQLTLTINSSLVQLEFSPDTDPLVLTKLTSNVTDKPSPDP
jgi:hypothetical protein